MTDPVAKTYQQIKEAMHPSLSILKKLAAVATAVSEEGRPLSHPATRLLDDPELQDWLATIKQLQVL